MEEMNILCSLNDAYVNPMLVMLNSMQKHNHEKKNLFIFSTSLSQEAEKKIKEFLWGGEFEICIKRIQFKDLCNNPGLSNDIFLRIFAFEYLPKTVEKVLYLDVDTIFLNDVRKIYDTNLEDKLVAVVKDIGCKNFKINKNFKALNIDHVYFNSGMLLMNLKEMRKKWNANDILKFIEENALHFSYQDQDVLNVLTKKDDLVFLEKWCNYQMRPSSHCLSFKNVVFLHFLNKPKPWEHYKIKKHQQLFWADWNRDDLFHKMTKEEYLSKRG